MSKYAALDKIWEDIRRCYRCGYCRDMVRDLTGTYKPCPVREVRRFEHYCARGRNTIARGLIYDHLKLTPGLRDLTYTCLLCGGCRDSCSLIDWAKVDSPGITRALREELHRVGLTPRRIRDVHRVKSLADKANGRASCQAACPVDQDAPSYIRLIAEGRYAEALEVIRRHNPLPSVCGRACKHLCESACRQSEIGQPVSIMRLKRFCADMEFTPGREAVPPQKGPDRVKRVAVVGSGPAGLAAANHLARLGFGVVIFEREEIPGGMMTHAIPDFTLPREPVWRDIERIKSLGVEIRTGVALGPDYGPARLLAEGFAAVILCLGTWASAPMGLPGEDLDGVWNALDFLVKAKAGSRPRVEDKVLVVGGGKVALDAARTALRLGARDVRILYRRTRDEMPVEQDSLEMALSEGVRLSESLVPVEILGRVGRVRGARVQSVDCILRDDDGRLKVVCVEDSGVEIEAGTVIMAVGQKAAPEALEMMRDQAEAVYAAGDLVTGPSSIVDAMASGIAAASRAAADLIGAEAARVEYERPAARLNLDRESLGTPRTAMPRLAPAEAVSSFREVELGFTTEQAAAEARRCLACDLPRTKDLPLDENSDILFFVGCADYFRYPETMRSTVELLAKGGITVQIAPDEHCCGSPAFLGGDRELAEKLRAENMAVFQRMGVKKIITACADCLAVLTNDYDLEKIGLKVVHVVQVIDDLCREGRLEFRARQGAVTFHDPCQLARGGQVHEAPRRVLLRVPDLELKEMKRIRQGTHCCGGGPNRLVGLADPPLAEALGLDRLAEAAAVGANTVVTACPWCRTQFEQLGQKPLQVVDLPCFLAQAAGIE
ncbi:MAG: heterodisulfide reductase-related iron-sulfur binding cluster [Thermodesulfobacteriota bacterium]